MSRSNNNKPFYVDVGTSIVAVRCASNHDVIVEYDFGLYQTIVQYAKEVCDRMNKEAENGRPLRNCDVGTAEEQLERHDKFCASSIAECRGVSTNDCIRCFARWSQMSYEKEGEE